MSHDSGEPHSGRVIQSMKIELVSKFDVGDVVTYTYEDRHSSSGQSRDTGPIIEVKYWNQYGSFVYWVQGPNGEKWGVIWERELTRAPAGATAGTAPA